MKESTWKSLGYTKQLEYVNRLETLNKQYKDMIKQLEEYNKKSINYQILRGSTEIKILETIHTKGCVTFVIK